MSAKVIIEVRASWNTGNIQSIREYGVQTEVPIEQQQDQFQPAVHEEIPLPNYERFRALQNLQAEFADIHPRMDRFASDLSARNIANNRLINGSR